MFCKNCGKEIETEICPSCSTRNEIREARNVESLKNIFLERDEDLVAKMSRGTLSNMVLGGSINSNYVALSNKRIYYSGISYGSYGETKFGRAKAFITIPLEKICSISFYKTQNIVLLILAFIFGLPSLFLLMNASASWSILPFIVTGIFTVSYFTSKKRVFIVSSPSAKIEIEFKLYGKEAIIDFSKKLGETLSSINNKT